MAYNEQLADRVRKALQERTDVEEKKMMGGLAFMVDDKMCLGIMKDELMVRLDPAARETALERNGAREMDFTGRVMKGFLLVGAEGTARQQDFQYWVKLALDYNPHAQSPKKKKK